MIKGKYLFIIVMRFVNMILQ